MTPPQGPAVPASYDSSVSDAWVYILRCCDGSLYTGWTNDVQRRLARPGEGIPSPHTARRLPGERALALPMPDRPAARREEARIKALGRPAKLELIATHRRAPV